MVPQRVSGMSFTPFPGRGIKRVALVCLGISVPLNSVCCLPTDATEEGRGASAVSLLREVRDTHRENLSRIVTVEGEALMRVYTRSDLPSGEVQHVTETVSIRYAWDKPMQRRWSEHKVLEFTINGETAPADHPEWMTRRHMVDREKHISAARARPGIILSTGEYPLRVLTATISPLDGEVEAIMNARNEHPGLALVYGVGDDFDLRFYFSNGGQDLDELLTERVAILEEDPNRYPGLEVYEKEVGGQKLVEMRTSMPGGESGTMIFTSRFDLAQGGNPVYISTRYDGIPLWESLHEYHYLKEAGVWYPSSAHLRNWRPAGDRYALTKEIRIMFGLKTSVNRPWSNPRLFTLEGLGLHKGDWVIDKFSDKAYPYEADE